MTYVDFDWETRSKADIKIVGGYNYAYDPSTEILCAAAIIGDTSYAWCPHADVTVEGADVVTRDIPDEVLQAARGGATFVAHNAYGFDEYVWDRFVGIPVEWVDTLLLARANSLPGGLDKCGQFLFNEGKDDKGSKIMLKLCKPNRTGRFFPLNRQNTSAVSRYCLKDVQLMKRVRESMDNQEPELIKVDRIINQRGFQFDGELAQRLIACDAVNRKEAVDNCVLEPEVLRSNPQLLKWLESCEVHLPNLQRGTITGYLEDESVQPVVRDVLNARIGATKITSAKVHRALGLMGSDGRIRNSFAYHAAHTGRWGGRGFSTQNLPRGIKCNVDELVSETMAGYQPSDAELSTLIRACMIGPFAVADYAQIEVRVLAWLAGQEDLLDEFRAGSDVYVNLASQVFNTKEVDGDQRQVGKALILGCGFGLGADTFEVYGQGYGIDFQAIGMNSKQLVDMYRDRYPMIAGTDTGREYKGHKIRVDGLWKAYGKAFKDIANNVSTEEYAGRCIFKRQGDDILTYLPSGRFLRYRNVQMEMRVPSWGGDPVPTIMYQSSKGFRLPLFPSKVAQNNTQAVARDLLGFALIQAENSGLQVVSHCHDEIIDQSSNLDLLLEVMRRKPDWAEGLPVDAEGKIVNRYCKV